MIDGISFIRDNYAKMSNSNDPEKYKGMYHPDILWCPPGVQDKKGADLVAFSYALKNLDLDVEVLEIEGINGSEMSYVTGLFKVLTYTKQGELSETLLLRGSWVVVPYEGELKIRYQVWNCK